MESFEVPAELRNMAESSVAQARKAVEGIMGAAQSAVVKLEERTTAAHTGAKEAGSRMMDFAQQNITNSFDYAERLVKAKDLNEIMQIQTEFAKQQMQLFSEQAKAVGQGVVQSAKNAAAAAAPKK
jgi:phasin